MHDDFILVRLNCTQLIWLLLLSRREKSTESKLQRSHLVAAQQRRREEFLRAMQQSSAVSPELAPECAGAASGRMLEVAQTVEKAAETGLSEASAGESVLNMIPAGGGDNHLQTAEWLLQVAESYIKMCMGHLGNAESHLQKAARTTQSFQ